jgi:putative transposase
VSSELRDDPSLVRYLRSFLCSQTEAETAQAGDKWFLDEVFLKINGAQHYLWHAVDQHGAVIDILVQPKLTILPLCASFASCCAPAGGILE